MKGQIFVIDLLFFALIVVLVIFIIINNVFEIYIQREKTTKELLQLEKIVFVEKLITDCNFFAYYPSNRVGVCYKNILDLKIKEELLEENNVCSLKINQKVIYNTNKEIKLVIDRGVIENNEFKIIEVGFC